METSSLCRICLAADVRMHSIVAGELQEMYESLSMTPLETEDKRPTQACYICFSRLKNCCQLRQSCVRSGQLLTEILSGGMLKPVELLQYSSSKWLQIRLVEHTSLEHEADSCQGMDYAYEVKLEPADTEVFEEDQLVDDSVYSVDTVEVLVKKEPSESNADVAVEQDDADLSHSAVGLHTECDIRLGIIKVDPDDVNTGTPQFAAQTYRKDTLLNSLKKTDQTMFKVEEPRRETKKDIAVKPIKKNEIVETRVNTDMVYNNKQNNSASDQNDAHKQMADNKISTNQTTKSSSNKLKQLLCNICQKCFSRKWELLRHTRAHTGKKPYECSVCKKCFNRKFVLDRHIRTHTGEKPYECNVCKKRYSDSSGLKYHVRSHTAEKKPFECNVCKKCFNQKEKLNIHIRTHTGEKPYECNLCKKRFNQKKCLEIHMRTHTGEKPFECNICKKCFRHSSSLKTHIRMIHTGEKKTREINV